ncbi:GNAT family N-acetyltransferase [Schumannella luteola]|uniref:GNAT superfamily N-acetyltransferase n=1 Tax=Schumannella luteola TaxID=472059 RepID=A0A852YLF2_9MICO|nr:GNAT family N-acetyltransferase [Schumannella luteola]NYH00029.1 GNAT superfamily N-acetyltransferase [Schumannella luteola]TPX06588.1 GNAT family N-acetyltransferase [Schumannella luteola]
MPAWSFRPASGADVEWMLDLKTRVMQPQLARLDRWSPERSRERFLAAFRPEVTRVIVVDGADAGLIAVRPADDGIWIEHFYLDPALQGRGIGGAVLAHVLVSDAHLELPFRLDVLQGSPARRLYDRHGFVFEREDEVDVWMLRPAGAVVGD